MDIPALPQRKPFRIGLTEAAVYIRTKHHFASLTRQTLHNWVTKGVGGVKLEARKIGKKYYTSKEWVDAFLRNTERQWNA